ncbi:DUF5357 family protein [Nodosilinea sp. P-1105]|uniref:DUF5357 family protein n=1 Tax=Nodosilinea sp. P-1105 TaxID=2546229 RepID=UPI00146B7633|nr:DUF5357 family protein [Nodosilinea sp. P-1105]NMF85829.1 hypothetical protein [Nodosilinea sp. P-1105]
MVAFIRRTIESLVDFFLPDSYFAWQTVIYMSLFSWLMSLLARVLGTTAFTVGVMATLSWIMLALGTGWGLEANRIRPFGIPIAPWVAGGILCLFMFGSWGGEWLQPALTAWPLVSFGVVAVPNLISWDFRPKQPAPSVRQQLVLLFFLSLLISSWFQFYFRIQAWIQDYPSLVTDNFSQSAFVYRLPGQSTQLSTGVTHLSMAEIIMREQMDGKPWSSVERWLLNEQGQRQTLQREVQNRMANQPSLENDLWQVDFQPFTSGDGYDIKIWAIWSGPTAEATGYYLEKSCSLMPVTQGARYDTSTDMEDQPFASTRWANLTCQLDTPRQAGHPARYTNRQS